MTWNRSVPRRGEIHDRGGDLVGGHETAERLACFEGSAVGDHRATRGEQLHGGQADPGGAASDDRAQAGELAHAVAAAAARSALQNVPSGYVYSLMEDACIWAEKPGVLGAA
jgi:hypothetical protein